MLDASRTEYREVCWTPFFHVLPALRHGRRTTTVPILRHRGGYVQDSTRILLWLDQNMPGFRLLPKDPLLRAAVLDIEARFDRVGRHVMLYGYSGLLDHADAVIQWWTLDSTPLQKRVVRLGFPLMRATFRNRFRMTPARAEHSRAVIDEAIDFLDAQLADGREFLVGSALTAADITACALLAPLVCPDEHAVYSRADWRAHVTPNVARWIDRPAAEWVRRRYRKRH